MFTAESSASHFGNPAGGTRLLSVRKGWVKSIPVSIIPIFMPAPAFDCPPSAAQSVGEPIRVLERFMSKWMVREDMSLTTLCIDWRWLWFCSLRLETLLFYLID